MKKIILQDFSPLDQLKVGSAEGGNEGRCGADTNRISWDEELGRNAGPGLGTRDFLGH